MACPGISRPGSLSSIEAAVHSAVEAARLIILQTGTRRPPTPLPICAIGDIEPSTDAASITQAGSVAPSDGIRRSRAHRERNSARLIPARLHVVHEGGQQIVGKMAARTVVPSASAGAAHSCRRTLTSQMREQVSPHHWAFGVMPPASPWIVRLTWSQGSVTV